MASTDAPRPFVLPGEEIDASSVPTHKKHPLRLGPSLRLAPGATAVVPTAAGQLFVDRRKSLMWVEHNGGKVRPVAHSSRRHKIVAPPKLSLSPPASTDQPS